jgi:hypothetical protein
MYKRRIRQWQLNKKNREHEIRAALQVAADRAKRGSSPVAGVRIGQRNVTWSEIERYLRRKRVKSPQKWAAIDSQAVEIHDARQERATTEATMDHLVDAMDEDVMSTSEDLVHTASNLQLTPYPSTPSDTVMFHKALAMTTIFYDSYFESHYDNPSDEMDFIHAFLRAPFSSRIAAGRKLLAQSRTREFFLWTDQAFGEIQGILKRNDPNWLLEVFVQVLNLFYANCGALLYQMLHFLREMTSIVLGTGHPIHGVADVLMLADENIMPAIAEAGLRLVATVMSQRLGSSTSFSLDSSEDYSSNVVTFTFCPPKDGTLHTGRQMQFFGFKKQLSPQLTSLIPP